MIQINEADNDQNGGENEKNQKIERQAEFHKQQQGHQTGNQLHHRISPGNLFTAIPASGTQKDKTENRNIIV